MNNYNVNPYFDDFNAAKNFHKILFRPGYPVQARELTQMQSILQNQIKKFGDHMFKNGSMIIPGNTSYDLNVRAISITLNADIVASDYEGTVIFGESSKVKVNVLSTTQNGTDAVFYCKTVANGEDDPTLKDLIVNETVSLVNDDQSRVAFGHTINGTAVTDASLGFINEGVFFVNGYFIDVKKQTIVLSSTSKTPTCRVGLVLSETIVTEYDDEDLLDPALGTSSENSPGAHRQKIELVLTKYEEEDTPDPTFIILFELEAGNLIKLVNTTTYAEIMKTLARRTYEESGNYEVTPYEFKITEGDAADELKLFVTKGISFVGGYEVDNSINRLIENVSKARSTKTVGNAILTTSIGNYLLVSDMSGMPRTWSYIELRDDTISTVGTPVGTTVGFAKVRAVEPHSTGIYKLYIFDAEFAAGKSIANVASFVEVNSGTKSSGNILNVYTIGGATGVFNTTNYITANQDANRSILAVSYDSTTRKITAKKRAGGSYKWCLATDYVTQATTGYTGTMNTLVTIQDPTKSVPILSLPKSAIKTTSDFIYSVNRQITITLDAGGAGNYNLGVGETLTNSSKAVAWVSASSVGARVGNILAQPSLSDGSNSVSVSYPSNPSDTIIISIVVTKPSSIQKSKTSVETSIVVTTPKKTMRLGKSDVYELVSVVSGSTDITKRFKLNTNQKDSLVGSSSISLLQGASLPSGSITITFKYFVNSSGDFASVDSYTSLAGDESFISLIPSFKTSSNKTYKLEDIFDFRPTSKDASFSVLASTTSGNATVTLATGYSNGLFAASDTIYGQNVNTTVASVASGNETQITLNAAPTGTNANSILISGFDATTWSSIPAGVAEPVANAVQFITDYSYYLPRIDTVCMTNNGTLEIISGISSDTPSEPKVTENEYRMKLCSLTVPAYTFKPRDVTINRYTHKRYTMADIAKLDNRLSNIEEITVLNMLEQELASTQIVDPVTGLNRFKSGFVVDNFTDHSVIDLEADSIAALDYNTKSMTSLSEVNPMNLILITGESSGYTNTDGLITLPYTEEKLVAQGLATRPQNINPFAVFKWVGSIKLTPGSDFWTESIRLADINVVNNVTQNQTVTQNVTVNKSVTVNA